MRVSDGDFAGRPVPLTERCFRFPSARLRGSLDLRTWSKTGARGWGARNRARARSGEGALLPLVRAMGKLDAMRLHAATLGQSWSESIRANQSPRIRRNSAIGDPPCRAVVLTYVLARPLRCRPTDHSITSASKPTRLKLVGVPSMRSADE